MRVVALRQKRHHTRTLLRGPEGRWRERERNSEGVRKRLWKLNIKQIKSVDFILSSAILRQNYKKKDKSCLDSSGYD